MSEQEFENLVKRFQEGKASEEEKALLEQWLDFRAAKDRFSSLTAEEKNALKTSGFKGISNRIQTSKSEKFNWLKVAAAILLLAVCSFAIWQFSSREIKYEVSILRTQSKGHIKKVFLSDGTIIWLKGNSEITYPDKFVARERIINLRGEALFEVAKDPAHPFIIHTGELTTRVLGTSFNIKSNGENTEIYVLTGKVMVTSEKTLQKVELLPSQKITYAHATHQWQTTENKPADKSSVYMTGTEYYMNFQNTSLGEIARQIEAKFNVKMNVNESIISCSITADLTDQSLNNTLDIIAEVTSATYSVSDGLVTLEGKGCD